MKTKASSSVHAAIWLPRFALQAALRVTPQPAGAVLAVLDGGAEPAAGKEAGASRIMHANRIAECRGIMPGMTASQAMARCMKLTLLHRMADEEERVQQELLECADRWTPDYESTEPGLCVLDLSAARGIRQRRLACGESIRAELATHSLEARVGFAGDPDHACLAAHAAESVLIHEGGGSDATLLEKLPVAVLHPAPAVMEVLRLWGVHTLAQLAALPREGVAARLGADGLHAWQLARGGTGRLLQRVRPAALFCETTELEHPVESLEPLLFVLRRMLETLCRRLAERWLVAAAEHLRLTFEDGSQHERLLRVAEPTRDEDLLLRVLHTHLDGMRSAAAVKSVTLELTPTRQSMRQNLLFERSLRDPQRFAETLAQLEALFGIGRMGKPRLLSSHRPDAFLMAGFLEPTPPALERNDTPSHGLPLCRFRPPRTVGVSLHQHRPAFITTAGTTLTITAANGPCYLSGDWWDRQAWSREVWEVAASDGALYQLAREGAHWVLDGVFG